MVLVGSMVVCIGLHFKADLPRPRFAAETWAAARLTVLISGRRLGDRYGGDQSPNSNSKWDK